MSIPRTTRKTATRKPPLTKGMVQGKGKPPTTPPPPASSVNDAKKPK